MTKIKNKKDDFFNELLALNVTEKNYKITNRESEHREFKLSYDNKDLPHYAKTMVAFANRDGGVLLFGIRNTPRAVEGIGSEQPDELVFAHFLKEYFEPEIHFHLEIRKYLEKEVLAVLVKESLRKPILCRKEKKIKLVEKGKTDPIILREGAIYYRYSSSSEEIKYPELRQIFDSQVQRTFHSLIDSITLINKVGIDKAAIVNATEMAGDSKQASVYITAETAKQLNWIEKGKFVETPEDGERAFYVVKQVEIKHGVEVPKPIDSSQTHPLTKTALQKAVGVNSMEIDAVLWKCNILGKPEFHFTTSHGKNKLHKFTNRAKEAILGVYPLATEKNDRKSQLKKTRNEYSKHLLNQQKISIPSAKAQA